MHAVRQTDRHARTHTRTHRRDRQADWKTDRQLTRHTYIHLHTYIRTDGQRENRIPPQAQFAGGIKMNSNIAMDSKLENDARLNFIVYVMKLKRVQYSSFTCAKIGYRQVLITYSFCTAYDITHWRNTPAFTPYAYKVRAILREAIYMYDFEIIKDKKERKQNAVFRFLLLLQEQYFG